jgi:D-psicose/D-tagatose/L-ribulose 3-epimerase
MTFKYSITLSSFRRIETIEQTLERLIRQGYDAVEMFGETEKLDVMGLQEIFQVFDIPVCGVTGMWGSISKDGWKRKFLSSDQSFITHSQEYVKRCVKMCQSLGGDKINICLFADDQLSAFDRNHTVISEDQKAHIIQQVIPILSKLARFAADHGVKLLLEPLNRYSTPYCTTAKDAVAIANQINQDNFGVLLDTFHMNIEEDSLEHAILKSEGLLQHTHFADNNRKMPGYAHIDFQSVVKSLEHIGYNQYISFEPNLTNKEYELATKNGLDFIKDIEKNVRGKTELASSSAD